MKVLSGLIKIQITNVNDKTVKQTNVNYVNGTKEIERGRLNDDDATRRMNRIIVVTSTWIAYTTLTISRSCYHHVTHPQ